jgi:maltose-binding protein MalE
MIDNGISYKDHYYGLPVRYDVRLLHYNIDYFQQAGLECRFFTIVPLCDRTCR